MEVFLSAKVCGAWSVEITSIILSRSPTLSASTSFLVRSGGVILKLVSASASAAITFFSTSISGAILRISSEVSVKWCGHTSAVTFTFFCFARSTIMTESSVEQWHKWSFAPVSWLSMISLATMISSTELVIPFNPSSLACSSSFMTPPLTRFLSSQCASTTMPNFAAFSIASRYNWAFMTDFPSSLIAGIPAFTIPSISASSFPSWFFVTAPTCSTLTSPTVFALLCT